MKKEIYPQKLIDEYDLILSGYPDLFKLRELVAQTIKKYYKNYQDVTLLEIGAGRGETTEYILKQTSNLKIIAIDNDPNMVKKLNHNLKQYITNGRLTVIEQDIFEYIKDIEDQNFEGVTSSWTIHNFKKEDRKVLLKEIYRILKPGGLFINMDKYFSDDSAQEKKADDQLAQILNKAKQLGKTEFVRDSIKHDNDDKLPDYRMPEKESITIINKIGFRKTKILKRFGREAVLSCIK